MIKVPALALFALFVICAVKAEKVGDIPRARTSDDTPPATMSGRESLRFLEVVSDMERFLLRWIRNVPLESGKCVVQAPPDLG